MPEHADAILGFWRIGRSILLSQYRVMWIPNWLALCIYGLVVQGDLPPMDKSTWSSQFNAFSWRPS
jgi:hypothetical protein